MLHLSSVTVQLPEGWTDSRLQYSPEAERTRGVQTNSRTIVAAQRYVRKYTPSL